MVRKWLLPTLSEVLAKAEPTGIDLLVPEFNPLDSQPSEDRQELLLKAHSQWQSAISSVEALLLKSLPHPIGVADLSEETVIEGLLITAPLPLFSHPAIVSQLHTITFTTPHANRQLLPCKSTGSDRDFALSHHFPVELLPTDPLADERFCLVLTDRFSLVVVLGEENGEPRCQFSFDPDDLDLAWKSLRGRIMLTAPHYLADLDELAAQFSPIEPDYRWVMAFSQYLLEHQPTAQLAPAPEPISVPTKLAADVELIQALTHEIRTPLTTIRTMTRLLLRQPDLSPHVLKRLSAIDRECTEQINRMELIFSGVELASTAPSPAVDLTTMSIGELLEQSLPQWQQQAERRNLNLAVAIPHKLPAVVSNPTMLDRVLTGLVENFTRNLPSGSHIQVEVTPVGDRLKLQFQSQPDADERTNTTPKARHAIGQLLTFQPETGNLSLNMNVTKNLFQLLGGKLIVREHLQQGEVLTIFLPLSTLAHS
ncbi:HAMP domain-containing sensor histidine kinase [Chamaesiphon sp. VAR_48_metabat_403]|uniref:sensor histidine kinase n=1 Tax=Chamaesiphon sp. VAR_48_metabat_403 TaxID=2964700 RepID=UPI00286E430E|nr:HAMP domain-containing sensor histidine kinase [Chamaesiphon sp. VAR_48_metabat_403]